MRLETGGSMLFPRKRILVPSFMTMLAGAAFAFTPTPEPGPEAGQAASDVQPHITNPDDRRKAAEDRFGDFQSEAFKQGILRAQQNHSARTSTQVAPLKGAPKPPSWRSIGPTNADYETNGITLNVVDSGRPRTILQDPTHLDTVYVLTAGGGLWKTTTFSQVNPTWSPLTDHLAVNWGAAAFGRSTSVLYVGTGDPFDGFPALGGMMLKSTTGGAAWSPLVNMPGASTVRDVKVDTSASRDIILVATDVGLFRSTDAGASYSIVLSV